MRNHASPERMAALIEQAGKSRKSPSLGNMVETAQRQVEQRDYKSRKRVLDFDDVMNLQREIVYGYRNDVLTTEDPRALVHEIIREVIPSRTHDHLANQESHQPDHSGLLHWIRSSFQVSVAEEELKDLEPKAIADLLVDRVLDAYETCTRSLPHEILEQEQRRMVLAAIDEQWQRHLDAMDELREGVYLRAQGQKDPLVEYKNEGYELFVSLMDVVKLGALKNLFRSASGIEAFLAQLQLQQQVATESSAQLKFAEQVTTSPAAATPGRNARCSCGSGRKYKHCCGRMAG